MLFEPLIACSAPKAYNITLFINTVYKLLLNRLIRSDQPERMGTTVVSKDKTLIITFKPAYNIAKQ